MKLTTKLLLSISILTSLHSVAQKMPADRDFLAFDWEISNPADNKFITKTSLAGWRLEYRKGIKHNLSVGIAMSWNTFDDYVSSKTYTTPGQTKAITTDMVRQVYTVPITLVGHYYFDTKSKIMEPYFGLGIGTQYAEHKAYFNIYEVNETNWGFCLRPEIGTLIKFSPHSPTKGLVSLGYNFSTNENKAFDIDSWNHFTINVGIGISLAGVH